jgi:hypothetical protein
VLVAAGLVAVLITWPVATSFSTHVVGGSGIPSDTMGYWWDIWNNRRNGLGLWGAAIHDQIGFPFGRPIVGSGNLLLGVFTIPAWIIASFASAAATLNVLVLAGIALTGAAMYLLIRWLGLGIGIAAWAGVAFMLAPYELFRAAGHAPLAHMEWAPLLLMAGIAWIMRPTWWRALLLAAATLFGWLSNPYYGAMASVVAGVILVVGLVVLWRRHAGARVLATQVGIAVGWLLLVVGIPIGLLIRASTGATEAVTRQRIELDIYGARLWDYLIPPPGTWLSSGLVGPAGIDPEHSPGGERVVFLGWVVILLALAGIALAIRYRRHLPRSLAIGMAVAIPVVLVAGIFSLASPTRLWGLELAMPSSVIFEYLPYLRAWARFGAVVLAAAIVVAAIGLFLIVRNGSKLWRFSWVAAALVLSAAEMPLAPPIGSGEPLLVDGRKPADVPAWQWLRDNRQGEPVIETPAFSREDIDRVYLGGQTVHLHPLANGGLNERSAAADFTEEFGDPVMGGSLRAYSTAGIRLVTIQPWAYAAVGTSAPSVLDPPPGARVLADFGDGSGVWGVTATPRVAVTFPDRTTWDPPRVINGTKWRYMRDSAVMRAFAPRAARVRVAFNARGYAPQAAYPLDVTMPNGRSRRFTIQGPTLAEFVTSLPKGVSAFQLSVPRRPTGDPVGPGAMSIETSQWRLAPVAPN